MKTKIGLLISLLILLFACGCSAVITTPELISTQTESNPASTEPPQITLKPYSSPTHVSELELEEKFTYHLDQQAIGQHCLKFPQLTVYKAKDVGGQFYAAVLEQNNISAISADSGELTPIFTPEFPQGHLLMIDYEHPWYAYLMVDSPNGLGEWNLHVVNLETGANTIVGNRDIFDSFPLNVYTTIDGGVMYLSTSTFEDGFSVKISKVYAIDLQTNEVTSLIDSADTDTYMSIISASKGYLLIENEPTQDPQALHLSLYDIANKDWIELPREYPASMPGIEYPYLIWKNTTRFEEPFSFTIYNIETGVTVVRDIAGRGAYDPILSGDFVIIPASTGKDRSTNSVVLYSLEADGVYAIQVGMSNIFASDAYVDHGNVIFNFRESASASDYFSYACKVPVETVISESMVGIQD